MMLSVLLRLKAYPLVSFGHDVVCTSSIDGLPLWHLLVMMLSVLFRLTAYSFGIFWSWCCLYFNRLKYRLLVIMTDWRHTLWYVLVMMWSVLVRLTKRYPFGPKFWSWCCLYFFDCRLTPLVSFGHDVFCTCSIAGLPLWYLLVMMLSVVPPLTAYSFGICWSWCCLYFFDWQLTPLVSFGHDVVCTSSIDKLTPLVSFGHDVVCTSDD